MERWDPEHFLALAQRERGTYFAGATPEAREISRRKLPERLELVEEMPLTPSGKIFEQALRERMARQVEGERRGTGERSPS